MKIHIAILTVLLFLKCISAKYALPELTIKPLKKGLHVSMPVLRDEKVQLFGFHANINKPIRGKEQGDISRSATRPHNSKWELLDEDVQLKVGDKINYWVFAQNERLGFDKEDQTFDVKELFDTPITCTTTDTRVLNGAGNTCGGHLLLEDNFNNKLKEEVWDVLQYIPLFAYKNSEFVYYQKNSPDNLYINRNILHIKPTALTQDEAIELPFDKIQNGCTVSKVPDACYIGSNDDDPSLIIPPVRSAKIRTKMAFQFGRVEIRAKLPAGDWLVPHLVLEPVGYNEDANRSPAEIFIAYARGNRDLKKGSEDIGNEQLYAGVSVDREDRTKHMFKLRMRKNWNNDFHNFRLEWTTGGLSVWVDDRKLEAETPLPTAAAHLKDQFFHLSIGLSVGGVSDFPENGPKLINSGRDKFWSNTDPRKQIKFLEKQQEWLSSWGEDDRTLQIDSVRIYAI